MRTKASVWVLSATVLGAAFGQLAATAPKDGNEARLAAIRNYLSAINKTETLPNVSSPMDHMPGAQPSLEHKLVPLLAQEVLSLHDEVAALKKQLEELKGQSGHNR